MIEYVLSEAPSMEIVTHRTVHVTKLSRLPKDEEEFKEWLFYTSTSSDIGLHSEYYPETEDYKDDIKVEFLVGIKSTERIG